MTQKKKIAISWSGGKDSMLALDRIIQSEKVEIDHLHTVLDADLKRVGLHGVKEELVEAQARSLGIPLRKLYLKSGQDHKAYEELIQSYFNELRDQGIQQVMFGDIFLEDLRVYRQKMLADSNLTGVYPLWKEDPMALITEFLHKGYKTTICAANEYVKDYLGHTIDHHLIQSLPDGIDVCGENGEYHTLVYDGPLFEYPLPVQTGEVVSKSYTYGVQDEEGSTQEVSSRFWFVGLELEDDPQSD